jgi:hypothetical protein
MNARMLVITSAVIEIATAVALMAIPEAVARLLLGVELSSGGIAVARIAAFGLLSLAIACWPHRDDLTPAAVLALFVYNLLAAFYLGYLRVGGGFSGYLLWPACVVHALLTALMVRPAYRTVATQKLSR